MEMLEFWMRKSNRSSVFSFLYVIFLNFCQLFLLSLYGSMFISLYTLWKPAIKPIIISSSYYWCERNHTTQYIALQNWTGKWSDRDHIHMNVIESMGSNWPLICHTTLWIRNIFFFFFLICHDGIYIKYTYIRQIKQFGIQIQHVIRVALYTCI